MLSNSLKYNFDWESVTCGFWRKTPSKYLPYIDNVHTIQTNVDPDNKRLTVHRIFQVKFNIPYIVQKFVSSNTEYYLLEETKVDLDRRKLSYKITGLTPDYYVYNESASFEESSNPGVTDFSSSIDIKIRGFGMMNRYMEKYCKKAIFDSINTSNEFKAMVEGISSASR